jgi:hypothetical protein
MEEKCYVFAEQTLLVHTCIDWREHTDFDCLSNYTMVSLIAAGFPRLPAFKFIPFSNIAHGIYSLTKRDLFCISFGLKCTRVP